MQYIDQLNWRYATKKFDPTKKITALDFERLKEAIRLTPTSYGLQLYKVIIVDDPKIREALLPHCWGQKQVVDADKLIVFCNYKTVNKTDIDEVIELKANAAGVQPSVFKGYGDFNASKLEPQSGAEIENWTAKQCYLAMGNLLSACAELKIDSCPMEGFEPSTVNEILGLNQKGLNAALIATVGYRSEDDQNQHAQKVRKSAETIFEHI